MISKHLCDQISALFHEFFRTNAQFQDFSGPDFSFFIFQDFSGPVGTLQLTALEFWL